MSNLVDSILIYSGTSLTFQIALWLVLMSIIIIGVHKGHTRQEFKGIVGWLTLILLLSSIIAYIGYTLFVA